MLQPCAFARAEMDEARRLTSTAQENNTTTRRNARTITNATRVACDALGTLNVTHHVHTNYIGSMNDECSICHAMRWTFEKRSICCFATIPSSIRFLNAALGRTGRTIVFIQGVCSLALYSIHESQGSHATR